MALNYRPRFRVGPFTFGKSGASVQTGIPGLTYRAGYPTGGNGGGGESDEPGENPDTVEYGLGKAAMSMVKFLAFLGIATVFWGALFPIMFFIIPLLVLGYTLSKVLVTYELGKKQEGIYKSDGRYKGGSKYVGSKTVDDPSVKIPYSESALRNRRVLAGVKTAIIAWVLFAVYPIYKARNEPTAVSQKTATDSLARAEPINKKPAAHLKKHTKHKHQ